MCDKDMGCGAGCCQLAVTPRNCFIGLSIETEDPPSIGDPKEEPRVCSAPPKPMDNITK